MESYTKEHLRWAITQALIDKYHHKKCGDCTFWMKSSECPREHNVNGQSRGPSVGEIGCDKFQENL